jgi:hypothetical protein
MPCSTDGGVVLGGDGTVVVSLPGAVVLVVDERFPLSPEHALAPRTRANAHSKTALDRFVAMSV